ncbi:D-alanyl-D-alanine carboxypeptidase/D-alanyl-D-alanine-endopeptidase [Streptomyces sp. DSM 44917]|uniref:D-alanyl-D-alanine carboxypeptidase/D-alanyl-D-alanine-endopeptidase n=1 Tax=Streptomyces boetiae TaxID=3075541 RepID=A0ABU2L795_9ACTN|nr:D-alanyl-D-alanine carboxypeptidase/D-alanyl-D-alanine-endopeptidase [Streptomyces sp. DSM 44917]MDT0307445.1 D-alanyl-D-alanine carboxypeptidase/D-alanyl-D-alanine-endopeptidase [Streptomyces sp. DSM 44917]
MATGAAAAGLAVAAGAVSVAGPWDGGLRTAEREQAAAADAERDRTEAERVADTLPVAAPVLAPVDGAGAPAVSPDALAATLAPLLESAALGPEPAGAVIDLSTGEPLWTREERSGRTPASTVKVAVAAAALHALGPDHRLATTAVWDEEEERVVLVGGGDPTLSDEDLRALAREAAAELAGREIRTARVAYDLSLYPREQLHPIGVNDNIALITPLQVNEGRTDGSAHGPAPRADDPAAEAAGAFAAHLAGAGLRVEDRPRRADAPEDADRLATQRSAPMSTLVEDMLTYSDNDLAEAIGRATALASGEEADFRGVGRALTGQLRELGLPLDGVRFADASGLDRQGRTTAALLTRALAAAADPARPELRAVLTGLPVAGFSGTLADRYEDSAGTGLVRAKTGTLTGVNTLAGTAVTPDGRPLAFAFLASDTSDGTAAARALDDAASALAACACR